MPDDAHIISAKVQPDDAGNDRVCLWAICDTEAAELSLRNIILIGTGHDIRPQRPNTIMRFIDTCLLRVRPDGWGEIVRHVFELEQRKRRDSDVDIN